jgi:hypothetical protein
MANSERTFGDILARAYRLYEAILQMLGFAPADADIMPPAFLTFLDSIDAMNNTVAATKQEWSMALKNRIELYFGIEGIKKRASYIIAYCRSRSDLKKEAELIYRICKKIQNYKKPKPEQDEKKRILGEQSYGDFVKLLGDLIEAVKQVPAYTPPNTLITVAKLGTFRTSLLAINQTIGEKYYEYSIKTKERLAMYVTLKDKMNRIKASVKSQYGLNSNEYNSIKGIRV